jgi:hypothetical protein
VRRLQACQAGLAKHIKPTWVEGYMLEAFLKETAAGTLLYPAALLHAAISGQVIYYDAGLGYHVFRGHESDRDGWLLYISTAIAWLPFVATYTNPAHAFSAQTVVKPLACSSHRGAAAGGAFGERKLGSASGPTTGLFGAHFASACLHAALQFVTFEVSGVLTCWCAGVC